MDAKIQYDICPECGTANQELKGECPVCGNRLFSIGADSHQRYIALVEAENKKRGSIWYAGWAAVASLLIVMPILSLVGYVRTVPGAGAMVGAMVISWRLFDLKKKRLGSLMFIRKYKDA